MSTISREEYDIISDHIRAARRILEMTIEHYGYDDDISEIIGSLVQELGRVLEDLEHLIDEVPRGPSSEQVSSERVR
ncbi:MAG: hypothetical protein JW939_09110 [Candidatus Thermoplasmatota archaeon]|nr:hypothetical protein [Candidatus Thermoplasmatota archaeon]